MTAAVTTWEQEARAIAERAAARLQDHLDDTLRPRMAQLIADGATVAIRAAAGEDTTTARTALGASVANLSREQLALVELHARTVALEAAWSIIGRLAGAAAAAS